MLPHPNFRRADSCLSRRINEKKRKWRERRAKVGPLFFDRTQAAVTRCGSLIVSCLGKKIVVSQTRNPISDTNLTIDEASILGGRQPAHPDCTSPASMGKSCCVMTVPVPDPLRPCGLISVMKSGTRQLAGQSDSYPTTKLSEPRHDLCETRNLSARPSPQILQLQPHRQTIATAVPWI